MRAEVEIEKEMRTEIGAETGTARGGTRALNPGPNVHDHVCSMKCAITQSLNTPFK